MMQFFRNPHGVLDSTLRHAAHGGKPIEIFAAHMNGCVSESKELLLREVLRIPHDFTVDDVLQRVEQSLLHVSRSTVYRTLQQMVDAGLLVLIPDRNR